MKNSKKYHSPKRADLWEKLRFLLVGCINTAVDFTVLNILIQLFKAPFILSNVFSTFCALCVSLILNKYVVFQDKQPLSGKKLALFVGITLSSVWMLQTAIIFLLTQQFPMPLTTLAHELARSSISGGLNEHFFYTNIAKIIATVASLVWNYYFYKKLVFKQK